MDAPPTSVSKILRDWEVEGHTSLILSVKLYEFISSSSDGPSTPVNEPRVCYAFLTGSASSRDQPAFTRAGGFPDSIGITGILVHDQYTFCLENKFTC